MAGARTRSPKSKAASKLPPRGVIVAEKANTGNAPVRTNPARGMSAQERRMLVARVAYFRAEKRGFAPGCELEDWVEAEAEVLRLIGPG